MTAWVRFERDGEAHFGTLDAAGVTIEEYSGDMFGSASPTLRRVSREAVKLLVPTQASKLIGLWNNFRELATKLNQAIPDEPLYFIKAASSYLNPGEAIRPPKSFTGKTVFEGELGIVIGKRCQGIDEAAAADCIFGYTCVNDVTGFDVLNKNPAFPQWARAKSFDTFGPFGPCIATGLDWTSLRIRTVLNGVERQNYPASDMILPPARIVSMIAQEMTLLPGDVIACGTSVGAGSMKPGTVVEIAIEGIGVLKNTVEPAG